MASHRNGPWHVVCVQQGAGFVTDPGNFHVITRHHCAVLNKDTFERDYTCTPIQVRGPSRAWLSLASSAEHPDPSGSHFTVANIHTNNECGEQRSVCLALFLLVRDLCLKLGAVVLTGNFSKAVEREGLPVDVTVVFRHSRPPSAMPAFPGPLEVTQLWSPGGETHERMDRVLWFRHVARVAEPVAHHAARLVRRQLRRHRSKTN